MAQFNRNVKRREKESTLDVRLSEVNHKMISPLKAYKSVRNHTFKFIGAEHRYLTHKN